MSETLQKAREVLIRIFKDSDLLDFLNMTNYNYGIVEVFGRRLMLCETQCSDLGLKGAEDEPLSTVYKDRLFIFDSLNATADAFLRKKGISFCDGEGNLNLALGAMTMESHGVKRQAQPQINLMTETSLKAILGLLSAEGLVNRPMREIAEFCGVSIGSVQRLIEALKQNHFIFVTPKGRFLKNMRGLLDLWVRGFNMVLRPKYYLGQAIPARPEAIAEALPEGVCWGGEQAAALRDGYLVPAAFSVFTTHSYRETCLMCKFLPVPVGNVSVYRKFWSNSIDRGNVAPDLVIYAELMSMGDSRCAEAAHRLVDHEKYAD